MIKQVLGAGALVLAGAMLTACGGPPADASEQEFCGVFERFDKATADLGDGAQKQVVQQLKKTGDELADVGTPEDIPDAARSGFERTLEQIDALDDDATIEDLQKLDQELSDAEKKNSSAFDDYLAKTCPDA